LLDLNLTARIARAAGPLEDSTVIEVGPGRVLTGIMRQIERSVTTLNVEDEKSLNATIDKIVAAKIDAA
jgi:16S rRNA A1518/A1519 N6-dimethyltransferase RsmA/KsgA/DIM1 with predicted DNA glycosylase/AP lyase activity